MKALLFSICAIGLVAATGCVSNDESSQGASANQIWQDTGKVEGPFAPGSGKGMSRSYDPPARAFR